MSKIMTSAEMMIQWQAKRKALAAKKLELKWIKEDLDSMESRMGTRAYDLCLPFDDEDATEKCPMGEKSQVLASVNPEVKAEVEEITDRWKKNKEEEAARKRAREQEKLERDIREGTTVTLKYRDIEVPCTEAAFDDAVGYMAGDK